MRWVAGLLLAVSLIGCSSSDAKPGATAPAAMRDETAAAKAMLLTVADLPAGWAEKAEPPDKANPLDKCSDTEDDFRRNGRTAKAETGSFSKSGPGGISHQVIIYQSAEGLISSLDRQPARLDCLTKVINAGKLDEAGVKYSGATVSPMSFAQYGDSTGAYRLEMKAKVKDSEAAMYIDFVYVRSGRVGFAIIATDVLSPTSTSTIDEFVKKAAAKVTQPQ